VMKISLKLFVGVNQDVYILGNLIQDMAYYRFAFISQ